MILRKSIAHRTAGGRRIALRVGGFNEVVPRMQEGITEGASIKATSAVFSGPIPVQPMPPPVHHAVRTAAPTPTHRTAHSVQRTPATSSLMLDHWALGAGPLQIPNPTY